MGREVKTRERNDQKSDDTVFNYKEYVKKSILQIQVQPNPYFNNRKGTYEQIWSSKLALGALYGLKKTRYGCHNQWALVHEDLR